MFLHATSVPPDATRARPYGLCCALRTYIHTCIHSQSTAARSTASTLTQPQAKARGYLARERARKPQRMGAAASHSRARPCGTATPTRTFGVRRAAGHPCPHRRPHPIASLTPALPLHCARLPQRTCGATPHHNHIPPNHPTHPSTTNHESLPQSSRPRRFRCSSASTTATVWCRSKATGQNKGAIADSAQGRADPAQGRYKGPIAGSG